MKPAMLREVSPKTENLIGSEVSDILTDRQKIFWKLIYLLNETTGYFKSGLTS